MSRPEIEEMLIQVEEVAVITDSKAGTWQVAVLKTILKALIFILVDMKNKVE